MGYEQGEAVLETDTSHSATVPPIDLSGNSGEHHVSTQLAVDEPPYYQNLAIDSHRPRGMPDEEAARRHERPCNPYLFDVDNGLLLNHLSVISWRGLNNVFAGSPTYLHFLLRPLATYHDDYAGHSDYQT